METFLKNSWGIYVVDYFNIKYVGSYPTTYRKPLYSFPMTRDLTDAFQQELNSRTIIFLNNYDILIWQKPNSSNYNVKDDYNYLVDPLDYSNL